MISCKNKQTINEIAAHLNTLFPVNDLGYISIYVGMEIEKNEDGIYTINQNSYIDKILKRFNLHNAKYSKKPLDTGYYKNEETTIPLKSNETYRSAIGSLLFLAVNSRPDISVSVSILSRKICDPTEKDWREVKRIFKYLNGTKDLKLTLGNGPDQEHLIQGYVDADWGGDRLDRKSNTGYIFFYKGSPISWKSKKQDCVSLSSTKAELVALSEACQI